jgi:O-antigen/teichoic acid export membrane protein
MNGPSFNERTCGAENAPRRVIIAAGYWFHLETAGKSMKASEFGRWAKTRAQGMSRFVLLKGVLAYGLPMFVIMTFLIPHPKLTHAQSALLWLLTGAAYGIVMWFLQEYRYRKADRAS